MICLKSKEEIEKLHLANKIVMDLHAHIIPQYIKPGVTTKELDRIAEEYIRSCGALPAFKGYHGFPATLCTSLNAEVVHGIPNQRIKLREGDIIGIDVGAKLDGYFGDGAKTYAVGRIDKNAQKLIDVTREALYKAIDVAKVGNTIGDIGYAIQSYVEGFGFSVVRDYCGHGIGKNLHEDPQIPNYGKSGSAEKIVEGMVLAIEPMINEGTFNVKVLKDKWTVVTLDSKRSAHFEHSIAIVDGKAKILGLE
ncbi:MAG: type I methionyl aminopeptidase [Fusobacteria bacterium]|nr:type I methionyl aminopeptidase [Fusobacteriota bacterium]